MKHSILITVIAGACLLGLYRCDLQRGMTEHEYTHGPYPKELPAGWRMLTDGKVFTYQDRRGHVWGDFAKPTACEAVEDAWDTVETLRAKPRKHFQPEQMWSVVPAPKSGDWCEVKK